MIGKGKGAPIGNKNAAGHHPGHGRQGWGNAALHKAGVTTAEHTRMMNYLTGKTNTQPNLSKAKTDAYWNTITSPRGMKALGYR